MATRRRSRGAAAVRRGVARIAADRQADPVLFTQSNHEVRAHVQRWRAVTVGEVRWEAVTFRSASEPVEMPVEWLLRNAEEWAAVTGDAVAQCEYARFHNLLPRLDPIFRRIVVRQRSFVQEKSDEDILKVAEVAMNLTAGCADGRPLRALPVAGIDSKFLERHRSLVVQFLDTRFEGQASELGLESFLHAHDESDHWILVTPLAAGLLPFQQQRIRASELLQKPLPASHILIVENERSLHQLIELPDTIAILGAGLNLEWMQAAWLRERHIAYWGDMDTWGLSMLAKARCHQPHLMALLMNRTLFDTYRSKLAVKEPNSAGEFPPEGLDSEERDFYRCLQEAEKGRIEQEFLPREVVADALRQWRALTC